MDCESWKSVFFNFDGRLELHSKTVLIHLDEAGSLEAESPLRMAAVS